MRQIWISKAGPPETLVLKEAPDPEPQAGEARIRVEASGVNFADGMGRIGLAGFAQDSRRSRIRGRRAGGFCRRGRRSRVDRTRRVRADPVWRLCRCRVRADGQDL